MSDDMEQRCIDAHKRGESRPLTEYAEELRQRVAAHPPLAELAGAIAAAIINVLQHQLVPLAVNAHEVVHGITAHLAPLYAELERMKAENAQRAAAIKTLNDEFKKLVLGLEKLLNETHVLRREIEYLTNDRSQQAAGIIAVEKRITELKAENARLQSLVNNAKAQFDDMVKICKGDQ